MTIREMAGNPPARAEERRGSQAREMYDERVDEIDGDGAEIIGRPDDRAE